MSLTQKQKALLEKAIKVRYNGLIQSLQSTLSVAEEASRSYPVPRHGDVAPADLPPGELRRKAKALIAARKKLCADIEAANEIQEKKHAAARKQRYVMINKLRAERDERILKTAFDGETKEVLGYLQSMPTAKTVAQELGIKLTKELRNNAQIGEGAPPTALILDP